MKNEATSAKEEFKRRTERLSEIICPLRRSRYEVDSEWRHFQRMLNGLKEDYEGLELNPDFQRGHIWSSDQQQRYICLGSLESIIDHGADISLQDKQLRKVLDIAKIMRPVNKKIGTLFEIHIEKQVLLKQINLPVDPIKKTFQLL